MNKSYEDQFKNIDVEKIRQFELQNIKDNSLVEQIHLMEKSYLDAEKEKYKCSSCNAQLVSDGKDWWCQICNPGSQNE